MSNSNYFPFSSLISLDSQSSVPAEWVISILKHHITDERKNRIDQVINKRCFSCFPIFENIYDQGNLSAVIRSSEAMGFGQAHIIETFDKFKKSKRTTAGSEKWVELIKKKNTSQAIDELKKNKVQILSTSLQPNSISIEDVDVTRPTALVFGNESSGVSQEMIEASDACVIIPMIGFVQSFNISVAGALGLWILKKKRDSHFGSDTDLNQNEKDILKAHYYIRSVDAAYPILKNYLSTKINL